MTGQPKKWGRLLDESRRPRRRSLGTGERVNAMPATIIHIPKVFVKDYPDPREQDVATAESIARAKAERERALAEPCVCQIALKHHWNLMGQWIGCEGAARQRQMPRNPERWNDPTPDVTAAVKLAMVDGTCGPRFEIEMAGYTNDEQLDIAHALGRAAVAAYIREMGK